MSGTVVTANPYYSSTSSTAPIDYTGTCDIRGYYYNTVSIKYHKEFEHPVETGKYKVMEGGDDEH